MADGNGTWHGSVEAIHLIETAGGPTRAVESARALAGRGLDGDHHVARGVSDPGRQLTLVEAEAIEALDRDGMALGAGETRRNVTTRGVPLNHLVGREFTVGEVRARGVRLCEPCGHLEKLTERRGICAALVHRGGLRAEVLTDGEIRVGAAVRPA